MSPPITLLTDFGTADGYVGEMKGVLATLAPNSAIVDITHEIPPQDIELARLTVARYWRRFPEGTIHIAVVDPGVGSARKALAVESEKRFLVGPDNGILSPALVSPGTVTVELPTPPGASPTFHGRDIFAPAAAAIATGKRLRDLGNEVSDPIIRRTPEPHRRAGGEIEGEIVAIDRFGNAITNIMGIHAGTITVRATELQLRRSYSDARESEAVALVGSSGLIEIAVRNGSAAAELGLERGIRVTYSPG